ncbi:MarR family winged helix-turn-helix transcriptional regulator [Haloechinothrix halophila]|uniref:MarR family winged helix-turn-helix transcriptional regulator n=1 Tax=Haloechinothrix halophila TaxID=1069073 RepID=UPI0004018F00|nr:MarR family transcriptional regulator [Haloechinothrix halophila]
MTSQGGELDLNKQVCFALYRASRALTQLYRPLLDELDLTYPQYLVLLVLWERGPTTVRELGQALDLDSGTLSPMLKRLATRGVIERKRSDSDERSVVVHLTEQGDELREQAAAVPERAAGSTSLDPSELLALRDSLTTLTDAVNARRAHERGTP